MIFKLPRFSNISSITPITAKRLDMVRLNMLRARGWRFLRYLHLADFLRSHAGRIGSFCSCGAGLSFAELALALEFPHIEFYATDIATTGRPNYWKCMDLVMRWDIRNIRFGIWDLLQPASRKFDIIATTEVLEHIRTPEPALSNMLAAAKVGVYALVPFADAARNGNAEERLNAYLQHEHFVCGYDADFFHLPAFQCKSVETRGVYWHLHGGKFRSELTKLTDAEIDANKERLCEMAKSDLAAAPAQAGHCAGIKALYLL